MNPTVLSGIRPCAWPRLLCLLLGLVASPVLADSDAVEGAALARQILGQRPEIRGTNTATLRIRQRGQPLRELPLLLSVQPGTTRSYVTYAAGSGTNLSLLAIEHDGATERSYTFVQPGPAGLATNQPSGNATMIPFAGSDFWIADLGLEFLHWPGQRIVNREMRRSRACLVLESTNPNPAPGAYVRVRSWIDNEFRGIVLAEAYDANQKLQKIFTPNTPTKVAGQWEVEELEMEDVQRKSRSVIKFDLTPPATK